MAMPAFTLSKKDKKTAREIIERGLLKEFSKGLYDFDAILHDWKNNAKNSREAYHLLFQAMKTFDKHIAARYDYMRGSDYIFIIAGQLNDGVIREDDLKEFSETARETILNIAKSLYR